MMIPYAGPNMSKLANGPLGERTRTEGPVEKRNRLAAMLRDRREQSMPAWQSAMAQVASDVLSGKLDPIEGEKLAGQLDANLLALSRIAQRLSDGRPL